MTVLTDILEKTAVELAASIPSELLVLQDQLDELSQQLKLSRERLNDAVLLKYSEIASSVRQKLEKPSGIIRFKDESVSVFANVDKKPKWDQEKLAIIASRIRDNGDDPSEFMTISYKVPESKYSAWPEALRVQFSPARTLNLGKQSFLLSGNQEPKDGGL